jgi:hypothetical protein
VPVVIAPRFTTLVGNGTYSTLPVPVAGYERLVLSFERGNLVGTGGSVNVLFEESNDGSNYEDCGGDSWSDPGAFVEGRFTIEFTKAWFRVSVSLAGTAPGMTYWAQGHFELRER